MVGASLPLASWMKLADQVGNNPLNDAQALHQFPLTPGRRFFRLRRRRSARGARVPRTCARAAWGPARSRVHAVTLSPAAVGAGHQLVAADFALAAGDAAARVEQRRARCRQGNGLGEGNGGHDAGVHGHGDGH